MLLADLFWAQRWARLSGRIIAKHVYVHEENTTNPFKILIVSVLMFNNEIYEFKTSDTIRIKSIYLRFQEGDLVIIKCCNREIKPVRASRWTRATREVFIWQMSHAHPGFALYPSAGLKCFKDIVSFYSSRDKPQHITGLLLEYKKGVTKKDPLGKPLVQCYIAKLVDINGRAFQVITWNNIDYEGETTPFDHCYPDDVVLIINAREAPQEMYSQTGYYTLTTLYPPVVNSKCIDNSHRDDLLERRRILGFGHSAQPFNPTHREHTDHNNNLMIGGGMDIRTQPITNHSSQNHSRQQPYEFIHNVVKFSIYN